ncbi:MAG: ASCH domain-containing protein [Planctomycetes bacterium]|nr:ASCH domain-containing protein [Planctomycetota bacterium]
MAAVEYALSLKQPWATLLTHGLKSIEVRRWPTARRGRILIHAARIPDPRPEVWSLVPAALHREAEVVGGIIGAGDLTTVRAYRTLEAFTADRDQHLNDPSWFQKPVLYGFVFTHLEPLSFRPYPGWMRFFPVLEKAPR